ncbi:alpha/beta-Hydrolases superfamily protein [Citrus sinensis]|uniref:Alpha/beta-Hydrolases superfamily protein n=1 Tax=Citrus sinensis TaxID=2711 RepID=A0ACB8JZR3_CITSI|nr:alpha/beta-Hydrolases superfamily protein [Citrus sinensis]
MLRGLVFSTPRLLSRSKISHNYRASSSDMGSENLLSQSNKSVNLRLSNVSLYTAEVLEIEADDPKLHVLFVPGNPAIGSAAQTKKNYDHGRLFSLDEQVEHKVAFCLPYQPDGLHQTGITEYRSSYSTVLSLKVGHSIGAYVALEMLKRSSEKVIYYIGLYPFLALIRPSVTQSIIGRVAATRVFVNAYVFLVCVHFPPLTLGSLIGTLGWSNIASTALSYIIASLGILPSKALRFLVSNSLGRSWSATAVEAACTHLSQLKNTPDWAFMRENQSKIAFLFGVDDHWGPQELYEEVLLEQYNYSENPDCDATYIFTVKVVYTDMESFLFISSLNREYLSSICLIK